MTSRKLPKKLYQYFWEVKPEEIDLVANDRYVIERLLVYGDVQSLIWLRENYPEKTVVGVVRTGRQLTRRDAIFFSLIYGIPTKEVRCLTRVSANRQNAFLVR